MHETALAEGILRIATDAAANNNAARITEVGLIIGQMSGVETEALEFAFRFLAKGTLADGAQLVIERKPLVARCDRCGRQTHLSEYNFFCPECGGVLKIISGREMQVAYVEAD